MFSNILNANLKQKSTIFVEEHGIKLKSSQIMLQDLPHLSISSPRANDHVCFHSYTVQERNKPRAVTGNNFHDFDWSWITHPHGKTMV